MCKDISWRVCVCVSCTQVVVLGDGCSRPGAWPLLGKVITKLHYGAVLLQHLGYLHLYVGAQLLPLERTKTQTHTSQVVNIRFTLFHLCLQHKDKLFTVFNSPITGKGWPRTEAAVVLHGSSQTLCFCAKQEWEIRLCHQLCVCHWKARRGEKQMEMQ